MDRTSNLAENQVATMRSLPAKGVKQVEIAAQFGISQSVVSKCFTKYGLQSTKL